MRSIPLGIACGALSLLGWAGSNAIASTTEPLWRFGPYAVRPHALASYHYEKGTLIRPGQPESSAVESVSAGVLVEAGTKWTLNYDATASHYSNPLFEDTVNHLLAVTGAGAILSVPYQFTQNLASTTDPSAEAGQRIHILSSETSGGIAIPFTPQTSLALTGSQSLRFIEAAPDSYTWSGRALLTHNFDPALSLAAGVTGGYTAVYRTPDSTNIGPIASATWRPSKRLSVLAQYFPTNRAYYGKDRTHRTTPGYSAAAVYAPFSPTSISVSGSRSTAPSFVAGQETDTTKWTIDLHQRLLGHLQLGLGVGWITADYLQLTGLESIHRHDKSKTYQARLSTAILQRGQIALFYQKNDNEASVAAFSYNSTQAGAEVSYRF